MSLPHNLCHVSREGAVLTPRRGGWTYQDTTYNHSLYDALYWFAENAGDDPRAAVTTLSAACAYELDGGCMMTTILDHASPPRNSSETPIFANFSNVPYLTSTQRVSTLSNFSDELIRLSGGNNR